MGKSFICLVSCKPYDDVSLAMQGIQALQEMRPKSFSIEGYLALADPDQVSSEAKDTFTGIRFGTSLMHANGMGSFAESVESQLLKERNAQFIFLGDSDNRQIVSTQNSLISRKLKESLHAGFPVILEIAADLDSEIEAIREKLSGYLEGLDENEREGVTLVYQSNVSSSLFLTRERIQKALNNCRAALEGLWGEVCAKNTKILFSIPKYTPDLLMGLIECGVDGACVYPAAVSFTSPAKVVVEDISDEPEQPAIVEETKDAEIFPEEVPIDKVKPLERIEPGERQDPQQFFAKDLLQGICLVNCRPYDNFEKVAGRVEAVIASFAEWSHVDCIFAFPYSQLIVGPHLESGGKHTIGSWGVPHAALAQFNVEVFFESLLASKASFAVLGDRTSRELLNISNETINQQIKCALSLGLQPILGISSLDTKEQLTACLQNISEEEVSRLWLLYEEGAFGADVKREADEVQRDLETIRDCVKEIAGEAINEKMKLILGISRHSPDPFSYLLHNEVDGICVSSSIFHGDEWMGRRDTVAVQKEEVKNKSELKSAHVEAEPEEVEEEISLTREEPMEEVVKEDLADDKQQEMEEGLLVERDEPVPFSSEEVTAAEVEMKAANDSSSIREEQDHEELPEGEAAQKEERSETLVEASELLGEAGSAAEAIKLVKLTVNQCVQKLAESYFNETYIPNGSEFESPEAKLQRIKYDFENIFNEFRSRAAKGWEVLLDEMQESKIKERGLIIKALNLPVERIVAFADVEKISLELDRNTGRPWYEVLGLTKKQMNILYESARRLYQNNLFSEASNAFYTLAAMHSKDYGIWFGYGMAKKRENQDLEIALDAFSMANALNPTAPEPFIHAAECYLMLGNTTEAERCLEQGKELMDPEGEHKDLFEWAGKLNEKLHV